MLIGQSGLDTVASAPFFPANAGVGDTLGVIKVFITDTINSRTDPQITLQEDFTCDSSAIIKDNITIQDSTLCNNFKDLTRTNFMFLNNSGWLVNTNDQNGLAAIGTLDNKFYHYLKEDEGRLWIISDDFMFANSKYKMKISDSSGSDYNSCIIDMYGQNSAGNFMTIEANDNNRKADSYILMKINEINEFKLNQDSGLFYSKLTTTDDFRTKNNAVVEDTTLCDNYVGNVYTVNLNPGAFDLIYSTDPSFSCTASNFYYWTLRQPATHQIYSEIYAPTGIGSNSGWGVLTMDSAGTKNGELSIVQFNSGTGQLLGTVPGAGQIQFSTGANGSINMWTSDGTTGYIDFRTDSMYLRGKLYVTNNIESEDNIVAQDDIIKKNGATDSLRIFTQLGANVIQTTNDLIINTVGNNLNLNNSGTGIIQISSAVPVEITHDIEVRDTIHVFTHSGISGAAIYVSGTSRLVLEGASNGMTLEGEVIGDSNIIAQDDIQADRYLFNNTQKNIYIGEEAGASYDASGDTASVYIGYNTAQYLNGGGLQAGRNIGIGAYVFQNGGNNTQNSIGIGYKTLRNSSTIGSVCIGTNVAPYIKGAKNFLLGSDNMGVDSNINSSYNVICGNGNLSTNQYNIGNIVLGVQATQISGDTMVHNIISGYQAMRSSSGTHRYNILMGEQNSYESNNMNYMISLGSRATYNCDNSDSSIVIGHYLYSGSTLNNRLCIGMFTKKLIEGWFDLDSAQINGDFNVTGDAYANSFNTDTLRMGGTITIRKTITLADDGTYALPAKNCKGEIFCTTSAEYGNFYVLSDGTTTFTDGTIHNAEADGHTICLYDDGSNAEIKNTSGGELIYVLSYIYAE